MTIAWDKEYGLTIAGKQYGYAWRNGPRWAFQYLVQGKVVAALRQLWNSLVFGHMTESCQECGRPYLLWWADDDLYKQVTGRGRYANGESAPGLYCLECFDAKAERIGLILKWKPEVFRVRF